MVAKNDVTGDAIKTKVSSSSYRDNYDLIFRKDKAQEQNRSSVNGSTTDSKSASEGSNPSGGAKI